MSRMKVCRNCDEEFNLDSTEKLNAGGETLLRVFEITF